MRFYVGIQLRLHGALQPVPYEVEKVDAAALEHRADFNLYQINRQGETLEGNAERYWIGDFRYTIGDAPGIVCEEVITASPLRVVRELPLF